jgi:HK97 gp10 family phage protein
MVEFSFEVTGLSETLAVFDDLKDEIGDAKARSSILIPATKEAMQPVLSMAKSLAPIHTGLLEESLGVTARRPDSKDKRSRYVDPNDTIIALVQTKSIPKHLKTKAFEFVKNISDKHQRKMATKEFYESQGVFYDARAIAMEFGTATVSPRPFMRVSLESQSQQVSETLGRILAQRMESYRAKNL